MALALYKVKPTKHTYLKLCLSVRGATFSNFSNKSSKFTIISHLSTHHLQTISCIRICDKQSSWCYVTKLFCTRLARGKFELNHQDLAGGKTCTVLTSMYVNRKGSEVGQHFLLETALNTDEKGFIIQKPMSYPSF